MEHALTRSGFECVHGWADFIGRYSELTGVCDANPLGAALETMSEDVSAGLMPRDAKLDAIVALLRRNADFGIWARAANIACNLLPSFPAYVGAPSISSVGRAVFPHVKGAELSKKPTVANRLRALWLAVYDFMERNPEAAADWAAGSISDGTLSRMLVHLPDQEPIRLVLRVVSILSTIMLQGGETAGASARKGICSLQRAQGVWKRKPSYAGSAQGQTAYGAAVAVPASVTMSAFVALSGGIALLCAVAAFLALSRKPGVG